MNAEQQRRLAQQISNILIPPFFLLLVVSILIPILPGTFWQKVLWWFILIIGPAVLPMLIIFDMHDRGQVSGKHLPLREERTIPYLITIVFLVFTILALYFTRAPALFMAMMLAYLGNTVILTLVNMFYKMSAHMMGAAGPLVVLTWQVGAVSLPLYLFLLLIGWGRYRLRVHTMGQIIAGGVSGILLTCVQLHFYLSLLQ